MIQPAHFPEDILIAARAAVAARVTPDAAHQYIRGLHDHFAVIQAACAVIIAERQRCPFCGETSFDRFGLAVHVRRGDCGELYAIDLDAPVREPT